LELHDFFNSRLYDPSPEQGIEKVGQMLGLEISKAVLR
jgi:hypothetical protein